MELLGIADLAKRWNYTRQGVHQKMRADDTFPKPVAIINGGRIMVFTLPEILAYEEKHKELVDQNYKRWFSYRKIFYVK